MFEPGDRVAVTVPGYSAVPSHSDSARCEPVLIETLNETRHALTGEALLAAHRKAPLKGVLVGSPANPTGTMMVREGAHPVDRSGEGAGIRFISTKSITGSITRFRGDGGGALPDALVIQFTSEIFLP